MKKIFRTIFFCLAAGLAVAGCNGSCGKNPVGPSYGNNPPSSGPSVGASGTSYTPSPNPLSITAGTTVTWLASLSGHTVHIDDGAGGCSSTDLTSFPAATTFNTKGIFNVHCDFHSACGAASCSGCTGMVMSVTVY